MTEPTTPSEPSPHSEIRIAWNPHMPKTKTCTTIIKETSHLMVLPITHPRPLDLPINSAGPRGPREHIRKYHAVPVLVADGKGISLQTLQWTDLLKQSTQHQLLSSSMDWHDALLHTTTHDNWSSPDLTLAHTNPLTPQASPCPPTLKTYRISWWPPDAQSTSCSTLFSKCFSQTLGLSGLAVRRPTTPKVAGCRFR